MILNGGTSLCGQLKRVLALTELSALVRDTGATHKSHIAQIIVHSSHVVNGWSRYGLSLCWCFSGFDNEV